MNINYMPVLEPNATEFAFLGNSTPMTAVEIEKWKLVDIAEIKSVVCEHDVWEVCQPPSGANLLTCKWVWTVKQSGIYKSRLVRRGFKMIYGVDYNETFVSVAKMVNLRIFLFLVAIYCLHTGVLDIKTAFLNAPLTDTVWIEPLANCLDSCYCIHR